MIQDVLPSLLCGDLEPVLNLFRKKNILMTFIISEFYGLNSSK